MVEVDQIMQVQPIALFRLLMSSLAVGIALGVLYDVLRVGRVLIGMNHYTSAATVPAFCPKFCKRRERKSKPRLVMILFNILLVTQDIVFCLTAGAAAAVLLFYHNNGEFRGFVIIAILVGLAAYLLTVGKLVIRASEYVVFAVKTAILYIVYYTTWPFIALFRLLLNQARRIVAHIQSKREQKQIARYHVKHIQYLTELAANGFLSHEKMQNKKKRP